MNISAENDFSEEKAVLLCRTAMRESMNSANNQVLPVIINYIRL